MRPSRIPSLRLCHTHCYGYPVPDFDFGPIVLDRSLTRRAVGLPPIDRCFSQDPTCYQGEGSDPAPLIGGSIMSYCTAPRPLTYGASGLHGDRSERVPEVLRRTVGRADVRFPTCLVAAVALP